VNKLNRSSMVDLRHIFCDIAGNILAYILCYCIFAIALNRSNLSSENTLAAAGVYLLIYMLVGLSGKLYDLSTFYYRDRVIKKVISGCFVATALVTFVFFFSARAQSNRDFYAIYFALCLVVHITAAFFSYSLNRKQNGAKKTLFVGSKQDFDLFNTYIKKTNLSVDPVGYVAFEKDDAEQSPEDYLGSADDDLERIIRSNVIDQVYVMRSSARAERSQQCVDTCVGLGMVTRLVLPLARVDCSTHISSVGTFPVVSYHLNCQNPFMHFMKRIIDVAGAFVGIILSSIPLLGAAIAIKLDSGGPVFFTQTRVGQNGRRFRIVKLRTMTVDAEARKHDLLTYNEARCGQIFKLQDDPRITRVGAFLRKTSIDELPQFFNVLAGDMSLVGTRPPTEDEVSNYECAHWRRLRIKPGITGLWQVSGRSEISDFEEIVKLDTQYMEQWSMLSDFKIMLRTVAVVLKRRGAC